MNPSEYSCKPHSSKGSERRNDIGQEAGQKPKHFQSELSGLAIARLSGAMKFILPALVLLARSAAEPQDDQGKVRALGCHGVSAFEKVFGPSESHWEGLQLLGWWDLLWHSFGFDPLTWQAISSLIRS